MVVGDGAIVRAGLAAVLDFLHRFAAPTGERGSILLMSGGLIVLGFLFIAFLFRSAIVGDLAPVANGRAPTPRARLPPRTDVPLAPTRPLPRDPFAAGREAGRAAEPALDLALDKLQALGADARIIQSSVQWKRVRLYRCLSCQHGASADGCEHERGLLAGAFESLSGDLVKVHETRCHGRGEPFCEFEIRHAPLPEARAR